MVANSGKNPSWARDELILALDLYVRLRPLGVNHNHPEIVALSDLLKSLPIHSFRPDGKTFRNPNSVYMKLCNFLPLDPSYEGKGLTRGGAGDLAVWKEFIDDPARLVATAAAIRATAASLIPIDVVVNDSDEEFPEGKLLFHAHVTRERNPTLVRLAKARTAKRHGRLACEACGFDFGRTYGKLGENYIECHHLVPVSQLTPGMKTKLSDIALVCSNCHRMIHRKRPWITLDELKYLVTSSRP